MLRVEGYRRMSAMEGGQPAVACWKVEFSTWRHTFTRRSVAIGRSEGEATDMIVGGNDMIGASVPAPVASELNIRCRYPFGVDRGSMISSFESASRFRLIHCTGLIRLFGDRCNGCCNARRERESRCSGGRRWRWS